MSNFVLSCCSTADLTKEHFDKRGIEYICAHYMIDGKSYDDDLYEAVSADEFYNRLRASKECSTSQINISEFLDHFTKLLEKGVQPPPVLFLQSCLHLSLPWAAFA